MKAVTVACVIGIFIVLSGFDSFFLVWLSRLPGTFAHELCHWAVAFVLGADPHGFNLIPARGDGGMTLGSVLFRPSWWNAAPIALAPFLISPFIVVGVSLVARIGRLSYWLLGCFVLASCLPAVIPSNIDFGIALSHPGSWPLGAVILYVSYLSSVKLLNRSAAFTW